jgi:hypothetical protein
LGQPAGLPTGGGGLPRNERPGLLIVNSYHGDFEKHHDLTYKKQTAMPQESDILNKRATFIQHMLPSLEAGEYVLEVEQEIWKEGKTEKIDGSKLNRFIAVQGARFSLDKSLIEMVYPPDASVSGEIGPYDNCLPHIIIKGNPGLPWLREPTIEMQSKAPVVSNDVKHDPAVAPWLAVLVIHEADLTTSNGFFFKTLDANITRELTTQLVPKDATIYDYAIPEVYDLKELAPEDKKGRMPDNCYSLFSHLLYKNGQRTIEPAKVVARLGTNSKPMDDCMYIDLKKEFFQSIAPTLEDLKYVAHVRQVDTALQPRNAPAAAKQQYSVVLANRIPKTGKAMALLVSLEQLEHALPGSGVALVENTIRIPVLYYWNFEVGVDNSNDFEHALKTLNKTPIVEAKKDVQLLSPHLNLLDLPTSEINENTKDGKLKKALKKGFVPFNHITRGEEGKNDPVQTVSWYRGPLVPYKVPEGTIIFKENLPGGTAIVHSANSADELLRYDSELQMLDTSYAAAWQLGRLLCLEDGLLAERLYEWKRENEQLVIAKKEAEVLMDQVPMLHSNANELLLDEAPEQTPFQQLNHFTLNKLVEFFGGE